MRIWLTVSVCAILSGCELSGYLSGPVGKAIRHEVREQKQKEIDLARVVPFQWDELFLFQPYTPRSEICKDLGLYEAECLLVVKSESTDDGEMFMAFRYKKKIVHTEMYIRFNGDFTPLDFKQPITPNRAKFSVKETGKSVRGEPWLKLRPVTEKERSNNVLQGTRQTTARP
jgi:hypothetical protein